MLGAVQGCVKSSTRMLAFFGIFKKLGEKKLDKKRGLESSLLRCKLRMVLYYWFECKEWPSATLF